MFQMHFAFLRNLGFKLLMERPLAVGATGGSLSALFLQLVSHWASETPTPFSCPDCPVCFESLVPERIDPGSFALGALCGLALSPLLELLHLVRQSWRAWVRGRLVALAKSEGKGSGLYTLL